MYSYTNFADKLRRYFKFSKKEAWMLFATILVSAFVLSFNEWGTGRFNLTAGLMNLFNTFLIVALVLLVQESSHRIYALLAGYKVEYKSWNIGLGITLLLAVFTNGALRFVAPGGIDVHHLKIHRLGRFRRLRPNLSR